MANMIDLRTQYRNACLRLEELKRQHAREIARDSRAQMSSEYHEAIRLKVSLAYAIADRVAA